MVCSVRYHDLCTYFDEQMITGDSNEVTAPSALPAIMPPDTVPSAVLSGGEAQVQGAPPEVQSSSLGAALDQFSGIRSQVVNVIAVAAFHENRRRAEDAEHLADSYRAQFHERDKENAMLTERIAGATELRRLRQILLSVGGPIAGAGITLCLDADWGTGGTLFIVGGVLMAVGHGWLGGQR
jgi:hypothetical protein